MHRIFIVEDDAAIAAALQKHLTTWGFDVRCAEDFRNVLAECTAFDPQLVLLDITLPFYNGYHWCQELRRVSNVPVVFISSASDNMNIVMAMNMGADDFVTKPFQIDVLIAKINALLRRSYNYSDTDSEVLSHNGITLNVDNGRMEIKGEMIDLSKNEYRLLYLLMKKHGKILTREKLLRALWDDERFVDDNTLTVNINRLRKKIEQAGIAGYIETKVGVGYMVP